MRPVGPAVAGALAVAVAVVGCSSGSTNRSAAPTAAPASASAGATGATGPAARATPIASPTTLPAKAQPPRPASGRVPRPRIVDRLIPFPAKRRREMVAYARRHYGISTYRLTDPHVIVEHYTETSDFSATYSTFAPDVPDSELHELPGVCSHFVVDRDGTIYRLVPTTIMCRHTVGLNYTAIGIEHVGFSDAQILHDARQMRSSLALTRWLRCRGHIRIRDVIGHNESLSSPYHHERVAALRGQTHDDWKRADMDTYRRRLARLPC
ncbi:MAG: N-acetylmuramoyl-L-alanine amidase [Actinobacteria bacterium]|nr:MAG: N-acetylmuramoyl-L-alanine amidase [Actinomycetota bacterium]